MGLRRFGNRLKPQSELGCGGMIMVLRFTIDPPFTFDLDVVVILIADSVIS